MGENVEHSTGLVRGDRRSTEDAPHQWVDAIGAQATAGLGGRSPWDT